MPAPTCTTDCKAWLRWRLVFFLAASEMRALGEESRQHPSLASDCVCVLRVGPFVWNACLILGHTQFNLSPLTSVQQRPGQKGSQPDGFELVGLGCSRQTCTAIQVSFCSDSVCEYGFDSAGNNLTLRAMQREIARDLAICAKPETSPLHPKTLQYTLGRGDWKFKTHWLGEQRDTRTSR